MRRSRFWDYTNVAALGGGITSSDSDVTAWIATGVPTTQAEVNILTAMVAGIKSDLGGITLLSQKLDRLWIYALGNRNAAKVDFVARASHTEQANGGTLSWTTVLGYQGDGVHSYIDTGYNPSTGTNYTQNAAFAGVYVQTGEPSALSFHAYIASTGVGGAVDGPFIARNTTNISWGINQTGNTGNSFAFASQIGFWGTERTGSTAEQLYKDGTSSVATSANVSGAVGNRNVLVLARNNAGTPDLFSSAVLSAVAFGANGFMAAGGSARIKTALVALGGSGNFP